MNILRILVFVLLSGSLSAGTVTILPTTPSVGGLATIEYSPSGTDNELVAPGGVPLHAVVYAFNEEDDQPRAFDVLLKADGKRYVGEWTVPQGFVFALVKVGNGAMYDMNGGLMWSFTIAQSNGRAQRGAHLREAFSWLGELPPQCMRKADSDEALEAINKELRNYPTSITARINSTMIRLTAQDIDQGEARAAFQQIASSVKQVSSPNEAIMVAMVHRLLGNEVAAEQIQMEAVSRFPKSVVEEQLALDKLKQANSAEVFVSEVSSYLERFPTSTNRRGLMESVLNTVAKAQNVKLLVPFVNRLPKAQPYEFYQVCNYLGANDSLRPIAYDLIKKGLSAVSQSDVRPPSMGVHEWDYDQRRSAAALLFVQGAMLKADGKKQEALTSFETSLERGGILSDKNAYVMTIELMVELGLKDRAFDMAKVAIARGATTETALATYRAYRTEQGASSTTIEAELEKLTMDGRRVLARTLVKDMLNLPAIDGTFQTLDGKPVSLASLRGKVVVVDYWATWCGPCRQSFPSLQKLYEKYRNNPNVAFAIVNVWERSDDRVKTVKDFLKGNPSLTFPMYLDKDDSVVSKYGVTGIPTKFYLGKDGKIQFKEVGLLPETQFIEEATNKIEVLLGQ
jgi:thiol-disulfide isomerase/thioredoxin